jgi:TonB-dependent receptor
MSNFTRSVFCSLGLLVAAVGLGAAAPAAPLASLAGQVLDAIDHQSVTGAKITVAGHSTVSDERGAFRLTDLAPGSYTLTVAAPQHQPFQQSVDLASGATALPTIALEPEAVQMAQLVVTEQAAGASMAFDAKSVSDSLTEVLSGKALELPTAQSASDLLKNVAGVSVRSGADGAANVTIRGMDSRFIRVTVDGQRQSSGSGALGSIPPEIVQSLEVSNALTPDQDADAIGGAINVTTGTANLKAAYVQGRHQITYNTLEPRPGTRNSFTVARPFHLFSGKTDSPDAGFLLTANFDDQYRYRENVRDLREWPALVSPGPAPYAGQLIPVLTQPRFESALEHRQRSGLVFNADTHLGRGSLFWRSNFTRDWSQRNRSIDDFDPAVGTPLVLTPDYAVFSGVPQNRRDQRQTVQRDTFNFALGGKTTVGPAEIDASLTGALTDEREPRTVETMFSSDRTYRTTYDTRETFLPRFSFSDETNAADLASISDPTHFDFNTLAVSHSDTRDREFAARFNTKLNLDGAAQTGYLKFGGKIQQRHRTAETDRWNYDPGQQTRSMVGLVGTPMVTMHAGAYRFGPIPDANAVDALLPTAPAVFQLNQADTTVNSTTGDYTATETIWATYGMARFKMNRWTILSGVRLEDTRITSDGNQLVFGPDGRLQSITPAQVTRSYVEVLPGLHVRFDPQPGLLVRSSITRTLNRPSYTEITPARTLNFIDQRSRTGNPDLKPYQATNFDLSLDKYTDKFGLVSVGLFFKKIDHFIEDAQYPITIGDFGQFIEFKRINGDSARVWGLSTGWQSAKWELPASLGTSSFALNCTILGSETRFPDRPGEILPLDGQQKRQFSLVLSTEQIGRAHV